MKKTVIKIKDLIALMDSQSNNNYCYYDIASCKFQSVTLEKFSEDFGIKDDFQAMGPLTDELIRIPSKIEIQEFNIMMNYAQSLNVKTLKKDIVKTLTGSGAYKKFYAKIKEYNLENKWLAYRYKAMKIIAIEWCKKNGIDYEE